MASRPKRFNYNVHSDLETNNLSLGISSMFSGSFSASNNVSLATNVTGLSFNNLTTRFFQCQITVTITKSIGSNLYELFTLEGHQTDSTWNLYATSLSDITGIQFSITSTGQVQYTSSNVPNFVSSTFRFSATQIANTGSYSTLNTATQETYILNSLQITNTVGSTIGTDPGALYVLGGSTFEKMISIRTTENAVGFGTGGGLSIYGGAAVSKNLLVNGNIGVGIENPVNNLDVTGTGRITTSLTTGAVYATNSTVTNAVSTNITTATLNASTGITTATAQITNANVTRITAATLLNTNAVSTNITTATLNASTGITTATAQITNANVTIITAATLLNTNAVSTNITTATLNASNGITAASAQITNANVTRITAATLLNTNAVSTNITTATLNASTGITAASAQITNLNVTSITASTLLNTNQNSTNITTATLNASNGITAANVQITNLNVTSITASTLLNTNTITTVISAGTAVATTYTGGSMSLSGNLSIAGTLTTVNITTTNISQTNVSAGTITATNQNSTNITTATLNASTGITAASAQIANANITTQTVATLLNTNQNSTNITTATLNASTGITAAIAQITNANITTQTVGTSRITTSLLALGNSNTVGNVFTTGGNVGIGITNPSESLSVSGNIRLGPTTDSDADYYIKSAGQLSISANDASSQNSIFTSLTLNSGVSPNQSIINLAGSSISKYIAISTANTERLRIDASGNVGIGTVSPGYTLDINGNGRFVNGLTIGTGQPGIFTNRTITSNTNYGLIYCADRPAAGNLGSHLFCNSDTSVGYVSINGSSYTLDVNGTGRFNGKLTITGSSGLTGFDTATNDQYVDMRVIRNSTSSIDKNMYIQYNAGATSTLYLYSNNTETMTLRNTYVGIGTNNPLSALHVMGVKASVPSVRGIHMGEGGVNDFSIEICAASSANNSYIDFTYPNVDFGGRILYGHSNDSMYLYTAGTERIKIDSSGNVGIGTTSPGYRLDVNGDIRAIGSWLRTTGQTGFYNDTYGKGIYVNDGTWVKTYPDRSAFLCGTLNCTDIYTNNNGIAIGNGTINFNSTGAGLNWGSNYSQIYDDGDLRIKTDDIMHFFCSGSEVITLASSVSTINTRVNINHSASGNVQPLGVYAPNIGGYQPWVTTFLGKTESTNYGIAIQGYYYAGSGSTSNYYFIAFNGKNYESESFKVYPGGSIAKTSGTFDIIHPVKDDPKKRLLHSFIEGPRCDLIYRGSVQLQNGIASVNIDSDCVQEEDCAMTQGTFEALCKHPVYYLQNNDSFDRVRATLTNNILNIICENQNSTDIINWMVIGERKDSHIKKWNHTNSNGSLVTEYTQQ